MSPRAGVLLALVLVSARASYLRPHLRLHSTAYLRARTPVVRAQLALDTLDITDGDGDLISFSIDDEGDLQMFVGGELMCAGVGQLEYTASNGTVNQDSGDGLFQICEEDREEKAGQLYALAAQTSAEWLGDVPAGSGTEYALVDASAPLPADLEALVNLDDEMRESRAGVALLWSRLVDVYASEQAALAAVKRNSAVVMPYLNKPGNIDGSWEVLCETMGEADARDVITKNPGILASNPALLRDASAGQVQVAASAVNAVESLPMPVRFAIPGVLTVAAVVFIGGKFVERNGLPSLPF